MKTNQKCAGGLKTDFLEVEETNDKRKIILHKLKPVIAVVPGPTKAFVIPSVIISILLE